MRTCSRILLKRIDLIENIMYISTICGEKKYFIDNNLTECSLFTFYKVSDDLHREFCFNKTKYISRSEYVNSLILLKNKPGIAKIYNHETTKDSVHVILELGSPIDSFIVISCGSAQTNLLTVLSS